jgi:murein DD-endopeptidase MepM/ murein hydrolase activator NlpD
MKQLTQRIIPLIGLLGAFLIVLQLGFRMSPDAMAVEPSVTVRVLTPSVPLGGTVFLHIDAPGADAVRVRDGDGVQPARRRADNGWEAVLGVWMEEQPGERQLTVKAEVNGVTITAPARYTITQRSFPVQRLRMSKAQDDIYESPAVEEEYRLIREAINRDGPERLWQSHFALPVQGRISTQYGTQRYRNGKKVGIHKGIDIAAPTGRLIYAANDGVVVLRGDFLLHGRTLVIDHGGGLTGLYIHLSEFGVSQGQRVKAGRKIARVGSTGVATGPHLHYALYVHGIAVDPLLWRKVPAGW